MERHHNSGTNNLFHSIHGQNVILSSDSTIAQNMRFSEGICFSHRPIPLNQRVCIQFNDTVLQRFKFSCEALRFGFTSNDPTIYRSGLPDYAIPYLTNKPGNWTKDLNEIFAVRGYVLFFYVTEFGDVHYGINGEEHGIFFTGVSTDCPLWVLIDIYGKTIGIEFINNRRNNVEVETIIPSLQTIENRDPLPQVYGDIEFQCLPFHKTKGSNIRLLNDRCIAERINSHYKRGYVFSQRPLRLGEKLVLQVLQTDHSYDGSLAFGLTTCDPSVINDKSEDWVVIKDVANDSHAGDEFAFKITENSEVQMTKNRELLQTLVYIDSTQKMWPFFDLNGSTIKVKVLGTQREDNEMPENVGNSLQVMNTSVPQPISRLSSECNVCYGLPINSVIRCPMRTGTVPYM